MRGARNSARVSCSDGSVPWGHMDLAAALRMGDRRAEEVCRTRASLAAHLDDDGKRVFAAELRECAVRQPALGQQATKMGGDER